MRVLVMSEHFQGALASIQGLGRIGHTVKVLAGNAPSAHARSRHVSKIIQPVVILDTPESKARSLNAIVRAEEIDVVIPHSDDDAHVVATAKTLFPDVAAFVAPPLASVAIARDKIATMEIARELQLDVPVSVVAEHRGTVPDAVAELGLPAVVKVPVSTASAGTFVVSTRADLKGVVDKLPSGKILVQRFVRGDRVGFSGFALNGVLQQWFGFRHLDDAPSSGTPAYAISDNDERFGVVLAAFCQRLLWTGGIDVDAIRDSAGKLFVLEINPRFSGTLVLADKLGINLPAHYAAAVTGEAPAQPEPNRLRSDVLFISYVPGEVSLIARDPEAGRRRAAELRRTYSSVDNLYPDDGPLCIGQMKEALGIAWNARRA